MVTDTLGRATYTQYDDLNRVIAQIDAGGNRAEYGYDSLGNRIVITDAQGNVTRFAYDTLNRVITTTRLLDGAPVASVVHYNVLGNRLESIDARGSVTRFGYDALNRNIVITDARSHTTTFTYDALGRRAAQTDGLGHTLVFTYDLAGRQVATADALGHVTNYGFDVLGNRLVLTDANGIVTRYEYDALNRLLAVVENYTGGAQTDDRDVRTVYAYDALGNRMVITNARGYTTTFTYDVLGRLAAQSDALGHVTQHSYDALGSRTVLTDANGEVTLYSYDALNRLAAITYTADATAVQYAYDEVGNRTLMTDSVGVTRYAYDDLYRLASVVDPYGQPVTYTYDAAGNRTNLFYPDGKIVTYTYDAANLMSGVVDWSGGATAYAYDSANRLISSTLPNGVRTVYVYDEANRLTRLTHTRTSDGALLADYQFQLDAVGNRIRVIEDLLAPNPGGGGLRPELGALPGTAEEVARAVTGHRAPGLSAQSAPTDTLYANATYILPPTPLAWPVLPGPAAQTEANRQAGDTALGSGDTLGLKETPAISSDDRATPSGVPRGEPVHEETAPDTPAHLPLLPAKQVESSGLNSPAAQPGVESVLNQTPPPGLYRYEENDSIVYTPSAWTRTANGRASRGYYSGSNTTGRTATLTFTGAWVGLGFLVSTDGGHAEVFLDGVSQGIVDSYSRYENVYSVYYRDLVSSTHTVSVTVLSTRNPNSSGNWVRLDYIDTWNGDMSTGSFEENDSRVITSTNWVVDSGYPGASGGKYYRDGSNAWFPFSGDSVTYQAVAISWAGEVELLVDGQTRGYIDLKSSTTTTRTLSLGNLGAGPHVLQVRAYRGRATVDAFVTPGTAPYYQPPVRSGVVRYEEDDPAIRYGGMSYAQMPQSWNAVNDNGMASDGYYVWSATANQTVTLTFTGTWAGFGYLAASNAGQVEMLLDDTSQGTLDTYARSSTPQSVYFSGLTPATHTLTLKVLGTRNAYSSGNRFYFDYFDVWDGTSIPDGTLETPFARTWNWAEDSSYGGASGGTFYRDGTAMWHAFTGESVTYQAIANSTGGEVELRVDGQVQAYLDLKSSATTTRTLALGSLGSGPHVLQVRAYRGWARVDAFVTPGTAPYYQPPVRSGVIRYEEDDPAVRYGGVSYGLRPSAWTELYDGGNFSDGYGAWSDTANQTVTLTFTGTWAGFGYLATSNAGQVEMLLDDTSQGTLDTYARSNTPQSVYFSGLTPATHTLTLKVLGTRNAYSSGNRFYFDYFDVWDGTSIPDGTSETPFARTWNWAEDSGYGGASGGTYYRDGTAMWHAFTGESVTYQAIANSTGGEVELRVDGQVQAYLDLKSSATTTRTLSLGSLGSGPHVLQVRAYRGAARVDAFTTPGTAPYYEPPVRSGVVRYEEDDPAIRYGGMSYVQLPQVWNVVNDNGMASDGYYVWSDTANQTVTLTFTGTWAGFGYLAASNAGQVEMLLDDTSQGTLDTYASANTPRSVYFKDLTSGTHTLTLRVLGTHGPGSTGNRFHFDYFDVWDGTQTPEGTFETPFAKTWNWTEDSGYGGASGGTYYRDGTAMWYAFTGDMVTYQAVATSWAGQVEVSIDGITRSVVSLYNPTTITRTFEYTQVGIGPHVLQVRLAGGRATVDAFLTPPAVRPVADFTAAPLVGTAPLTVTLTNQSIPTRTITSYLWNFGDGVTSTLQNPVHAYTGVGAYTVRLTANTERHSDTETKAGYVTVVPTSATVITYTYDGLYRLTNATYSGAYTYTFGYGYDAVGNRTAMTKTITSTLVTTYTYDAADRLTSVNGQAYTWDNNGNLLADGSATYAYDSANRLISTTLSGVNTQFGYNGDGIRLRLLEAGTLTTYTQDYAAPLPVVLQAKTGSAATQYVYSLGTRPVAEYEAAAWEYLLADPLGSVRQLADPSGDVTLLKSHEPYGSVLNSQGTAASIFGYSGEQMDTYIKLVFLRARYYSPDTARFLSKDTWQGDYTRPLSFNGWNYAEGNPINSTDRSGLSPNVDCSQWFLFQDLCKKSNGPDDDPSVLIARESLFENIAAAGLLRGQVKFGWDYTTSGYTWAALLLMHFLDGNGSDYNISFNSGDPFVNDPGITRATRTFGDPAIRDEADFIVPLLHDFLGNYVQPVAVSGGSSFSVGPISLQGASTSRPK